MLIQRVCLEVQREILPRFGFEGTRRGVFASGVCCAKSPNLVAEFPAIGEHFLVETESS